MKTNPARGNAILIVLPIVFVIAVAALGYVLVRNGTIKLGATTQTAKSTSPDSTGKIKLTYAVHWSNKSQTEGIFDGSVLKYKGLKQYLDEYTKLHPNIEFDIQVIAYNDYADKLKILSDAGAAPDIYQIYSPWGVSYVKNGVLDKVPDDIVADIQKNYVSTKGFTINGQIAGIPTEINVYALLYNMSLFKEAGIANPPKTWSELVSDAAKLTKKDASGNITQYGIAFSKGNDWQVVDPFLSLLYSNGGEYLSADNTKALFNSPAGIAALDAELQLFKQGSTDINGNFFDFGKGKVAMVIAPPWTKSGFQTNFNAAFESTVGVAPVPYMMKPATLQYSWFMGVMAKSQHKQEAWDFLRWFASEQTTPIIGPTRYGTLLAENIGAIPSRKVDFSGHKEILGDFFTKVYVDQMKYGVAEPNVLNASTIKATLMKEIEAAWAGKKTAMQALNDAATAVNAILVQNAK
jgi:multiple sugar transport system substrate-binding protein